MALYLLVFLLSISINILVNKYNYRKEIYLAISLLFLAVFVGISDMLGGYDRYIYSELFDGIADITRAEGSYTKAAIFYLYPSEFGYSGYNILVSYITANRYIFILLTTFVIYLLYYFSIKKYCANYPVAVMLFMGLMFFFTFTYLRQMIGVGAAWLGLQYIYKRKLYIFLLCILIAATFHNSAIVLLPLYFIPTKRFKKKQVIIFMTLCLLLGLSGGPAAVFRLYGNITDMTERASSYSEQEIGFRYEYIIEAFVFLFLILRNYTRIPETKKDIVMLNTSLGFCAILLLFVYSLNGGRLGWFYLIGLIATLSTITSRIKRNSQTTSLITLISLLLFVRIVFYWGFMLTPYKTFLTNGIRDYDPIYQRYEYDYNYAKDKFYR